MNVDYSDLRDFIDKVDAIGDLRRVSGARLEYEIGAITEVAAGLSHCPAILFDKIPGQPAGNRVFTNATVGAKRAAMALGIDHTLTPLDALRAWKERRSKLTLIAPQVTDDVPYLENVMDGEDVDLRRLPSPVWHPDDGGPYIGSGALVMTRDPESNWVNSSIYRIQVHDEKRVTIQFDHNGRHGAIISKRYWDKGEPCPVAIVCGQDPALFISGFEYLPEGASELDFAGAIKGAPVPVHPGPRTGLPIPARAEIVLEGLLMPFPQDSLPEGPFGEFTGYYAADKRPAPIMHVTAIYHRHNPILLGSPPLKPPRFHFGLSFRAASMWSNLEAAGVTDIAGAWQHVSQLMTVISLKQRYAGHAKRAALIAAANSYMGRIVVVVDEDVDPSNLADVMWAVTTRAEPSEDVDIIRNAWSSSLDPRISAADRDAGLTSNSKMIIDACIPFQHRDSYPKTSALSLAQSNEIMRRWRAEIG
ncbi:UbiD family decarboxylase [Oryzicola mucosus]|uniref:UbiD family decarboxylase n=1 Tax=Oryzicola mucosus TaxID=2767425 RepID=A0A8J6PML8_9HYPH|nr:UbiD family decarboxylase [Oryzicola mucosus]MBD0417424.1 UbiD family decarboxylase [Oryzicola mucosus]